MIKMIKNTKLVIWVGLSLPFVSGDNRTSLLPTKNLQMRYRKSMFRRECIWLPWTKSSLLLEWKNTECPVRCVSLESIYLGNAQFMWHPCTLRTLFLFFIISTELGLYGEGKWKEEKVKRWIPFVFQCFLSWKQTKPSIYTNIIHINVKFPQQRTMVTLG